MKTSIATDNAPAAIGPYSQAIEAQGSLVFVSGQIPINPATGEMPESIADQARQSLANVKAIVEAAGLTLDNVVKTTVLLKDISTFAEVNQVYAEVFAGTTFPARAAYAVADLPAGARIEIEAIAVK